MQIVIDLFSDVVCPWCYVGQRQLGRALAQFAAERPEVGVAVCRMPYFLNPQTPAAGEPYRPFLEAKFGSAAAVDALQARVAEAGRAAGLDFAFDRIALRPNTLAAHRLLHRAQSDGRPPAAVEALAEALFAAYFLHGRDIGDADVLADLAVACGDERGAVVAYLAGDADADTVATMAGQASGVGIGSVPFFVFNRRVAVAGAQPPEILLDALRRSLADGD